MKAHAFEWNHTPRGLWIQREDDLWVHLQGGAHVTCTPLTATADEQAHASYGSYVRPVTVCRQITELLGTPGLSLNDIITTVRSTRSTRRIFL